MDNEGIVCENEPQQRHSWRENNDETTGISNNKQQQRAISISDTSRDRICMAARTKYPKKSMCAKALVLNDLISHFNKRKSSSATSTSSTTSTTNTTNNTFVDNHNFCRKSLHNHSLQIGRKQKILRMPMRKAAELLMNESRVADLVTVMKSSRFKITDQQNPSDYGLAQRGLTTLSCYDKIPREPLPEIIEDNDDGSSLVINCHVLSEHNHHHHHNRNHNNPDLMPRKLEDISIECDIYGIDKTTSTDGIDAINNCKKVIDGTVLQTEALQFQQSQIDDRKLRFYLS